MMPQRENQREKVHMARIRGGSGLCGAFGPGWDERSDIELKLTEDWEQVTCTDCLRHESEGNWLSKTPARNSKKGVAVPSKKKKVAGAKSVTQTVKDVVSWLLDACIEVGVLREEHIESDEVKIKLATADGKLWNILSVYAVSEERVIYIDIEEE